MANISVIIPTFNRVRFLTKAIDSLLNQGFADYEIIVINDGSTDETRKVLEGYANKIKYIYQENSGVSSARNAGIMAAQGEWVAFLDSDDEWTEDYLSTQVTQIEKYPQAIGHITNAVTVLPNGERSNHFAETKVARRLKTKQSLLFERPLRVIIKRAPWFLQSSILKRDVLLSAGLFDENMSIAEDLDVIARVALRGAFTICGRELVEIFKREEKIENLGKRSIKNPIDHYGSFCRVFKNLLSCRDLTILEKVTVKRTLSRYLRALGNLSVVANKRSEARAFYKKSFSRYPSVASLIKLLSTYLPTSLLRAFVRNSVH